MELHLPNLCFFASTKFNARNIIFNQRPILINKICSNSGKNCKNTIINTIYTIQELHLFSFSFSRVILAHLPSS